MMRNSVILCFWLALCAVGLPRQASALKAADGADFADYSLRNASNQVLLPGRLFTPPEAQLPGAEPRPLIINLAGSVGNGTDNIQQLEHDNHHEPGDDDGRSGDQYAQCRHAPRLLNRLFARLDRHLDDAQPLR